MDKTEQQEILRRWAFGEASPTDEDVTQLDDLIPDNVMHAVTEANLCDEDARQILVMGAFLANATPAPPMPPMDTEGDSEG